ncbi:hypothetical protein [Streptomyces chattanoogensis]|uniref:hypothetical protein n=1 Tax=Streptomyces chattanoogensis TaxID=66876 RepID=UPI00368C70E3
MADDPYDWLDKDAAERLLRGDPVGATGDGDGARELQQLLEAAAALGAAPAASTELPGEAAAVAAFHRAQQGSGARPGRRAAAGRASARPTGSDGVAERTRLVRPFRRGFAVALAVCAIGGVAVAAGTGVLPFQGGGAEPSPSASVSGTPDIFESRGPGDETDGGATQSPGGTPGSGTTRPGTTPSPGGGRDGSTPPGHDGHDGKDGRGRGDDGKTPPGKTTPKTVVLALCRDYEAGGMDDGARGRLERVAGGAEKVHTFCRKFLAGKGGGRGDNDGEDGGRNSGGQNSGGQNSGGGEGDEDGGSLSSVTPSVTRSSTATTPAPSPSLTTPAPTSGTPTPASVGQV